MSLGSQTPLTQVAVPAATVQDPSSVGLCPGSLGTGIPLASWGTQAFRLWLPALMSHHVPVAQSLSAAQPFEAMHTMLVPQTPDRQTVPPLPAAPGVQGPSPSA